MNATESKRRPGDLAGNLKSFALVWGLPIAALVAGGWADVEAYAWPPALAVMGVGCLVNAVRCGRLHCFITGPFFLAAALAAVLHGTGLVSLGPQGWTWIGLAAGVGGVALTYLPEWLWGRYIGR